MPHDATPKQIYFKKINFSQFNTLLENDYRGATHTHTQNSIRSRKIMHIN